MLDLLLVLASTEGGEEGSQSLFYAAGGLLAAFAVLVALVGLRRPDWPESQGAYRAINALAVLLVAAAVGTAITSG